MMAFRILPVSRLVSLVCAPRSVTIRFIHNGEKNCNDLCTEVSSKKIQQAHSLVPDIPDFYKGKTIFITGGTGFMGKVLVERLLTTCPEVERLYILMRGKKEFTPEMRLKQLKESKVFEILRGQNPSQLDKLVALDGDLIKPEFGLSEESRKKLEEVSMVFHMGASVRLIEPLKNSVTNNLLPTISLLKLCDTLTKLEVFVYVSTEYCNAEKRRVDEKVYPPPMELETLQAALEGNDVDKKLEKKLIGCKPSSYAFAKSMAEYEMVKHGCDKFTIGVFRPGAVISSVRYPFPGWIENWNGSSGVIAGCSTGILSVFPLKRSAKADMVPVDITIDTLIAAGWELALDRPSEVRVYNCTTQENPITWGFFADAVNRHVDNHPSINVVRYPRLRCFQHRYIELLMETILQTIPIYVIHYTLSVTDKKYDGKLLQSLHKLQEMREALLYYGTDEFYFVNENVKKLRRRLSESDKKLFCLDPRTMDWDEVMMNFVKGTRRHVLKEPDSTLEKARARVRKLSYARTIAKAAGVLAGLKAFNGFFK